MPVIGMVPKPKKKAASPSTTPVDTRTIAQRGGTLGGSQSTQPPIDVETIDQRGGTLGGSQSTQKPVDTQTVAERGGTLGGDKKDQPKTDTKTIAERGGTLTSRGGKSSLNPVIDKRTAKQKMKDAQNRRNS